ncbi:hypothetical protein MUP38_01695 [Candidatus Bathyarchaeota archaeon]|nr:hypothetical protein [Candidatus Bathyarchaeota archaeon]
MNLFLFLSIWTILWYIPIPPKKFKPASAWRIISLTIGLFIFLISMLSQVPLSIFVYLLVFSRLSIAFIEWSVSIRPISHEEAQRYSILGTRPNVSLSFKHKRKLFAAIFISALVISACSLTVYSQVQRITNATYFNSFILTSTGLPFSSTIPDDMVRLVTQELATSIARRHMSEFGSNTQVLDCHVTKSPEGKLVWVAVIGSTNVIAENYVKGFVIVDATDPTATPTIVHSEFNVGEGLWFDRNIPFRNYMADMSKTYGVAYLTWDIATNKPIYVVTRYDVGFDLVRRYATPLAYDWQGNLQYEPASASDIPAWMTQVYDENWLENMIDEMGSLKRGSGFDYWAGGFLWFVPPSRDRFQMTEDTRYIVDPETSDVVALVCVNPVGNQRTLSGVFKATREGIEFYDFTQANYISGTTAEDLVEGRLPKPAAGNYYATMPLLYTVETSSGNYRLAWYVPVYWYEESGEVDETVYLAGFAIVDASDTNKIALSINQEGVASAQIVRETRQNFVSLFGVTTHLEFNATVL